MPTEQEKEWIAAWRRAGPELERIRREELRRLDDQTGTRQATWLGVIDPPAPRPTSGLVQFQAWMMKWKRQLEKTQAGDTDEQRRASRRNRSEISLQCTTLDAFSAFAADLSCDRFASCPRQVTFQHPVGNGSEITSKVPAPSPCPLPQIARKARFFEVESKETRAIRGEGT